MNSHWDDEEDDEDPYVRTIFGEVITLEDAVRRCEVSPIIKRFGTWAMTEYGVECLATYYAIPKERLAEPDWLEHMQGKAWIIYEDFRDAFNAARAHFSGKQQAPILEHLPAADVGRPRRRRTARSAPMRVRFLVMKRDHYRCQLCGVTAAQGMLLEVDHKVARANGGTNEMDNLWTLCQPCNNGKGTHDL